MPKKKQNSFRVKNYYAMPKEKRDIYIENIRHWLFEHPDNDQCPKVIMALEVALCANELEIDDFTQLIVETIC